MKTYIECLDNKDKAKIVFYNSTNFCFVDGKAVPAAKNVDIPVAIGNNHITLNTELTPNDIPSRKVVKTANIRVSKIRNLGTRFFVHLTTCLRTRSCTSHLCTSNSCSCTRVC